jgi:hypothetical protein
VRRQRRGSGGGGGVAVWRGVDRELLCRAGRERGGEALDRVAGLIVGRTDISVRVVTLACRAEVVGVAAAAECCVAELA